MNNKNILIIGGQTTSNKGAQAMSFISYSQLKKKYTNHKIYLMSTSDYLKGDKNLKIPVELFDLQSKLYSLGGIYKLFLLTILWMYSFLNSNFKFSIDNCKRVTELLKNTEKIYDISGFQLSSQRGVIVSISYILNILLAKKYKTTITLLPQSFGPFNYFKYKYINTILNKYFSKSLNYSITIFAREYSSLDSIKTLTNNHVSYFPDLVLLSDLKLNKEDYYFKSDIKKIDIKPNSVAIIPNTKLLKYRTRKELVSLYNNMINKLQERYNIYLLSHSDEDFELCQQIYELNNFEDKLILINEKYNCIELEMLLSKFKLLVASRYHSIIHSYKNNKSVIIIGWADKYNELARLLSQSEWNFDIRQYKDKSIDNLLRDIYNLIQKKSNSLKENENQIRLLRNSLMQKHNIEKIY